MRKKCLTLLPIVFALFVISVTHSYAAQVSVKGLKPYYIVGESVSWTVTATRGDMCSQTSSDPTIPQKQFNFLKLISLPYKISATAVGETKFTIVCQTSGSVNFSIQIADAPPPVSLLVTGNKQSLFAAEVTILSVTGTPADKCAFSSTSDGTSKLFSLDRLGNYKYRMQAPKTEGQVGYTILCSRSGKVDLISQVVPRPVAMTAIARHNGICKIVGEIADLPPSGKGICTPQKRSSTPIWKTITEGTACFNEGITVDIPSNRFPRMKCSYKNGSLQFVI